MAQLTNCAPARFRDLLIAQTAVRAGRLNCYAAVRKLRARAVELLARDGRVIAARTDYGFELRLPVSDWELLGGVLRGLLFEPSVAAAIAETLWTADVMVDGGAHAGLFTVLAARQVGPEGRVVAFEPHPLNVECLRRNVEDNVVGPWVFVEQAALADSTGSARFSWSRSRTAHGTLVGCAAPDSQTTEVRAVALDDYCAARGLRPALIKLDLEGGETAALEGMRESLPTARCVILEVNGPRLREQRVQPEAIVARAIELGGFARGAVLPIDGTGRMPLDRLSEQLIAFGWSNVMLFR